MTYLVIDNLLNKSSSYTLPRAIKQPLLETSLIELDKYHRVHCDLYRRLVHARNDFKYFLPVQLFKTFELKSIPNEAVFKVLTSSGTTSSIVSKIFLDAEATQLQKRALNFVMQSLLGNKRLPMLIIDQPGIIKDRKNFSARGAGILGMLNFGREHTYALDHNMELNLDIIQKFIDKNGSRPIFIFGFTFMIWQFFINALKELDKKFFLNNAILLHGGGWKKLQDLSLDNHTFKRELYECCQIRRIHNFYGMIEQIGSVFLECESGYFHCPNFSDIHVIDPKSMQNISMGNEGVILLESLLPHSYPGHRILTEDVGVIIGEDDCLCGRLGKYFIVNGRMKKSENRGCSDTYE